MTEAILKMLTEGWVGTVFAWLFLLYVGGAILLFVASTAGLLLSLVRYRSRVVADQRIENFRIFAKAYLSGKDVNPAGRVAVISAWEALEGEDNPYHLEVMKLQAEVAGGDQDGLVEAYLSEMDLDFARSNGVGEDIEAKAIEAARKKLEESDERV